MSSTAPRSARPAALAFIFVTVLIDMLSFGVIIPVLPHLVKELAGGSTSTAAYWVVLFGSMFSLIQFVASPIQGALSDRYGRRPVILLSCLGLGLDFVFMALAPTLVWLFLGRMISAMTSASFTTANAYIADVTTAENRARGFGMIGAAFGLGFIVGPVLGGVLGDIDPRLPFWVAACLSLANFLYGWFVLPESHPKEKRSLRFDWSHANPVGSLQLLASYPQVFGLAAVVFLANLAHYVYPSVFVLFADYRYGWGEKEVGYVLGVVGVLGVIVNALLVGRMTRALGERRTLLLGLACGVVGFAAFGLAAKGWMFLLGLPISALWALAAPATQSLITRQVGAEVQGRVQGALTSLVSVAGIVGPVTFAGSFGYFVDEKNPLHLPGVPFLIAAVLLALALAVAWRFAQAPAAPAQPVQGR
ncbi:tetracycline resistance MFS efflux pump [Pseudoxanthomonas kalamensis DSM 18571]|uniref:TCR/Tet family MFS transporter n=1 Tax=Pseudoxanthomonas kalamensis TaxID=289483 RepID=UPI00139203F9|nr:TCR/Tet family MFS transporter [Pseudoxanthomonas kalamensis]KAF1712293.1 tetracycline resistance MFS efflux pump [Pseudoxanthomonas kalamensis DSM 18571]